MSVRCGFPNNTEYKFNPFPYSFPTERAAGATKRLAVFSCCGKVPLLFHVKHKKGFDEKCRLGFPLEPFCDMIRTLILTE